MAFNNDAFFDNGPQMALLPLVRTRLVAEGLETIEDFADFKKDQLKEAIKNLRTPIPGIIGVVDVNHNYETLVTIAK